MKTKEFIKSVEELGYVVFTNESFIQIYDHRGIMVGEVSREKEYQINSFKNEPITKTFVDLLIEFAETPLDEREEEKKFYLTHRWMKPSPIDTHYLNHWIGTNEYWMDYENETEDVQTQFTLGEIEEIKEKFDTDLSDFEMVEVEE